MPGYYKKIMPAQQPIRARLLLLPYNNFDIKSNRAINRAKILYILNTEKYNNEELLFTKIKKVIMVSAREQCPLIC